MLGIWSSIKDLTFCFQSLKGQPIFNGKIGKIGLISFIRRSAIPKRIGLSQCQF